MEEEHIKPKHWSFRVRDPELMPPPGPLAEELLPELSTNALRHFMTFRKPEGHFHSAWRHIEFGMNQRLVMDEDIRLKYIDDAKDLLRSVVDSPKAKEDTRLGALTLMTFVPVLTKRALGQTIESDNCIDVFIGLGSVIKYMELNGSEGIKSWRIAETVLLAVAARTGQPELLLFPTSPREESSASAPDNHDGYFIANEEKVPVQQKMLLTGKIYAEHIHVIEFLPIVNNALHRCGYHDIEDPNEAFDIVLGVLIAETHGEELKPHECQLLNLLSRSVAARYKFRPNRVA